MVQSKHRLWNKPGFDCKICLLLTMTLDAFLNHLQSLDPNISKRAMITHIPYEGVVGVK